MGFHPLASSYLGQPMLQEGVSGRMNVLLLFCLGRLRLLIIFNIQMQSSSSANLFMDIATKVRNQAHFCKIVKKEGHNYEFRSFQIENMTPEAAIELYQRFQHKYYVSKDLKLLPWFWHEQQKRLFVWFMTIYSYYASKHNRQQSEFEFDAIAHAFFRKDPLFVEYQYHTIVRQKERVAWNEELDEILRSVVGQTSQDKWGEVSLKIFIQTGKQHYRSFKQCRERWFNHLDERKIRGNWTRKEDFYILQGVVERDGKHWSKIVPRLMRKRTEHMIKNRFHTLISKQRLYRNEKDGAIARRVLRKMKVGRKADPFTEDEGHYSVDSSELKKPMKTVKKEPSKASSEQRPSIPEKEDLVVRESPQLKQQNISNQEQPLQQSCMMVEKPEQPNEPQLAHKPFESYNYELEACNYGQGFGNPAPMMPSYGGSYGEMCPSFSYNYTPSYNQFIMFPPTYIPMAPLGAPKSSSNGGVPTGDTYVPTTFNNYYQQEAFGQEPLQKKEQKHEEEQ